ncbi:MAG: hypothetical protein V2B19_10960 [Pseudomonadota bacterium]
MDKATLNKYSTFFNPFLLTVIITAAIALSLDWATVFNYWKVENPKPAISAAQPLSPEQRDFLILEYKNAVEEIRARVNQECLLFGFKFSIVGAVLALFFNHIWKDTSEKASSPDSVTDLYQLKNSPKAAAFFWAAVITSSIIDCRILFHCDFIVSLGDWIKLNVEANLLPTKVIGWERYVSENLVFSARIYPILRLNVHLLTLLLLVITVGIFFKKPRTSFVLSEGGKFALEVSRWGGSISFVVFALAGIHFQYIHLGWWVWCFIWVVVGISACFLVQREAPFREKKKHTD